MRDDTDLPIPFDNIRGMLQLFTIQLDHRLVKFREGTRFAKVRQSDIRIFISAVRTPQTIAELAREHHVTRQAVQSSVQRLAQLGVVELVHKPNNQRDKLVTVTERGKDAKQASLDFIGQVESEMAQIIGTKGLNQFRTLMVALVAGLKARAAAENDTDVNQATGI
jgi:DNA-binding MarR family transcriptional regulator